MVSERFEVKESKKRIGLTHLRLGILVKSKTVVWTFTFFFFNNRPNPVVAKIFISARICQNCPEWPKWLETARNLTRGGTGGIPVPVCIPV